MRSPAPFPWSVVMALMGGKKIQNGFVSLRRTLDFLRMITSEIVNGGRDEEPRVSEGDEPYRVVDGCNGCFNIECG